VRGRSVRGEGMRGILGQLEVSWVGNMYVS
jgi:hypothetical protein